MTVREMRELTDWRADPGARARAGAQSGSRAVNFPVAGFSPSRRARVVRFRSKVANPEQAAERARGRASEKSRPPAGIQAGGKTKRPLDERPFRRQAAARIRSSGVSAR